MTLQQGARVGRYRIDSPLGAGGMGVVYKAEDTRLKRMVALKFLPEDLSRDPRALARFEREAQAASALNHLHICTVYDIDVADGRHFIAMELLEGRTLKERLGGGPLPAREILDVALQLVEALEAAHANGIIHRDIKPANIFVTSRRHAKLLDFGLAMPVETASAVSEAPTGSVGCLTGDGVMLGTVGYMSPEQVRGEPLDARTDLFSLGVVLYEMATGTTPFPGATSGTVLSGILTQIPVAPAQLNPDMPPDLNRIVVKLLEKDRALRYQSAADLRVDLDRLHRASSGAANSGADDASIVVLPFENLSPDPENAYFADGLTEEIIADLSKIALLRVISRTSAMHYKGTTKPLPAIARELSVRHVLEGSVRRAGNSLRITAQLIDAATDHHLWAEKYTGTFDDVFDMQEKVSRAIVATLRLKLTAAESLSVSRRPIPNVAAFDCYIRARNAVRRFTVEGLDEAQQLLEAGLKLVGENALIHAGLAYVHFQFMNVGLRRDEAVTQAEACAARALELEPQLPQAHVVLGLVQMVFRGDQRQAIGHLRRALSVDPNDDDALFWLGFAYCFVGRNAEARPLADRIRALDPLNPLAAGLKALGQFYDGDFSLALETTTRDPAMGGASLPMYRFWLAYLLTYAGRCDEALALLEPFDDTAAPDVWVQTGRFLRFVLQARPERVPELLTPEFLETTRRDCQEACYVATLYAMIGDHAHAVDWLEQAVNHGFINYPYLALHDPFLAKLRGEVRFETLMQRVKREWENFDADTATPGGG